MINKFRIVKNYAKNCYEIYEVGTDESHNILKRSKRPLCLGYTNSFVDINQFLETLREVEASILRCLEDERDVYSLDYIDALIMINNKDKNAFSSLTNEEVLTLAYHSYLAEKSVRKEIEDEVKFRGLGLNLTEMLGQ